MNMVALVPLLVVWTIIVQTTKNVRLSADFLCLRSSSTFLLFRRDNLYTLQAIFGKFFMVTLFMMAQ